MCFLRKVRMQGGRTSCWRLHRANVLRCRDMDHCAGKNLNGCFTFLLIPATTGYADKHLSATLSCMVDVPVVTAAWFKGDIGNVYLFTRDRGEVTVTSEILCISGVWFSDRKIISRWNVVFSSLSLQEISSFHTSLARRNAAHAFGHPA